MNAIDMAQRAYSTQAAPIRTHRRTEYDAFSRVTRALAAAAAAGSLGFPSVALAMHENRRLWTLLAASVSDRDNHLPGDLRGRIFYLSRFTEAHSRLVLKGEASLEPLIEINTAVMRGLAGGSSK